MNFVAVFAALVLGINIGLIFSLRAKMRCYRYAVDRADFTERGCAYSDMATVIILDGKVDEFRSHRV